MKKVVSVALFGEGDAYSRYVPAWVRAFLNLHPTREGWALRFHVGVEVLGGSLEDTLIAYAREKLIDMVQVCGAPTATQSMLWRMYPVFEDDAEYVFCRDLDSLPTPRDRAVMDQFIASGATIHTVHDNAMHTGIMGGLCGFHAPSFKESTIIRAVSDFYVVGDSLGVDWKIKGADQAVLNVTCLRAGGPMLLEHRYAGWWRGPTQKSRPPGAYTCKSASMPVPHVGISPFNAERAAKADLLADHLGAAGFDIAAAMKFYDEYGDPKIVAAMHRCESHGTP